MKVVALNFRVNKLDRAIGLTPIRAQPQFSSSYQNSLVNNVLLLNNRVVRLEKAIGIATNNKTKSNAQLKNIAMKINALCQRIVTLEQNI